MNRPTQIDLCLPPCAHAIDGVTYRFDPKQYFAPSQMTFRFPDNETFSVEMTNPQGYHSVLVGSLNGLFREEWLPSDNAFGFGWRNSGTEVAVRGRWPSPHLFEFEVRE